MMWLSLLISLFMFVNSNEILVSHKTYIPGLIPLVEYDGKYISLLNSENLNSVHITIDDNVIIEDNTNVTIQDLGRQNLGSSLWNLDTLDNTIDGMYAYNYSGLDSIVYVIDSGLFISSEFDNRVKTGISFVSGSNYTEDCLGHGTHVSSIIGSKTYGVAKNVTIVPVKIFGCSRIASVSTVLKSIYWVIRQTKGVVNLSLGGDFSATLNSAIKDLIDTGFIVVSAAGNNGLDACNFSPSSEPNSIVVGCTNSNKMVCNLSNEGKCVTLFAPGENILGLKGFLGQTAYMSGTSMSAPHVSGIAAILYSVFPGITQKTVKQLIIKYAANGTLSGLRINSPNLEVRGIGSVTIPTCIKGYGCRIFNFCGFKTRRECLLRKKCKYVSGKCKLRAP